MEEARASDQDLLWEAKEVDFNMPQQNQNLADPKKKKAMPGDEWDI